MRFGDWCRAESRYPTHTLRGILLVTVGQLLRPYFYWKHLPDGRVMKETRFNGFLGDLFLWLPTRFISGLWMMRLEGVQVSPEFLFPSCRICRARIFQNMIQLQRHGQEGIRYSELAAFQTACQDYATLSLAAGHGKCRTLKLDSLLYAGAEKQLNAMTERRLDDE